MLVLDAGCRVKELRFTPDGRLLAGSGYADEGYAPQTEQAFLDVWTLPTGERLRVPLPAGKSWHAANELAVHPTADEVRLTFRGRSFGVRLADGQILPGESPSLDAVAISPDGSRTVFAHVEGNHHVLYGREKGAAAWERKVETWNNHLAGFLPDGDRFVTVTEKLVHVRSFAAHGADVATAKYPTYNIHRPLISPTGRRLGVIGYASMYVYDLAALGKPQRIGGGSSFGDFRSFAFHPPTDALAVIHGGPTLVKLYDGVTLKPLRKFKWNIGPLRSVAFSPDGTLAAAGGDDGKIVVWDVDL